MQILSKKNGEKGLVTIIVRTSIIYIILVIAMRLMGKRQIGELEVSELVITLLVSEVASLPITDTDIPLSHALVPIITLLFFEVSLSMLAVTFPRIKNLLTARPTALIYNGKLIISAMKASRITADELVAELRQQGIADIDEVLYAILEQNGKITVVQKARFKTPTVEQLNIKANESGISHIVIEKGTANDHGLSALGLDREALARILKYKNVEQKDVYLMMINDGGNINIILRSENEK